MPYGQSVGLVDSGGQYEPMGHTAMGPAADVQYDPAGHRPSNDELEGQ